MGVDWSFQATRVLPPVKTQKWLPFSKIVLQNMTLYSTNESLCLRASCFMWIEVLKGFFGGPIPCIIFLDGLSNDHLCTVHLQISWLPAPRAWLYASILIRWSIRCAPSALVRFVFWVALLYMLRTGWKIPSPLTPSYFLC